MKRRHSLVTPFEIAIVVAFCAIIVAIVWHRVVADQACADRGGALMRDAWGKYECIKALP